MKKLYTVTIETEITVVAESEEAAVEHARHARQQGLEWDQFEYRASVFTGASDPSEIPFGDSDDENPDRTIEEWIELGAAPEFGKLLRKLTQMDYFKKR